MGAPPLGALPPSSGVFPGHELVGRGPRVSLLPSERREGCSRRWLQPCLMCKAKVASARSGQGKVTSRLSLPACLHQAAAPLCLILFSPPAHPPTPLSQSSTLTPSLSVHLSAYLCGSLSLSFSFCLSVFLCVVRCLFLRGLHNLSFLRTPRVIQNGGPGRPSLRASTARLLASSPACPSSSCVLPPPASSSGSPCSCAPVFSNLGLRPLPHQPPGLLPATQPGSP